MEDQELHEEDGTVSAYLPRNQENWLQQVAQEWKGPDGVRLMRMATGITRLCIEDKCFSADPNAVDIDKLVEALTTLGVLRSTPHGDRQPDQ